MFHAKDLLEVEKPRHIGHMADRGFANQSRCHWDWDFTWLTANPLVFYIVPEGKPGVTSIASAFCADIRIRSDQGPMPTEGGFE